MSIAKHIDHAAEHLRAANHATHSGHLDGPTAAVVVGNLRELVARLPQLLDHLRRSARRADPAEHYDDRPGVPVARTLGFARTTSTTPATSRTRSATSSPTPTTTSATSAGTCRRTDP